jgi:serine/threonine protein phosphatase 1
VIYAVGDIHGEAEALRELLARLPVQPSDLLIFLGDAINRGPDSFDCLQQILAFDRCPKVFIQGNHEKAMLLFLEDGDIATDTR